MRKLFTTAIGILACTASFAQDDIPNESNNFYVKHTSMEAALKAAGLDGYATENNGKIIAESTKNIEKIKKTLGDNFGGHWIEYDDDKVASVIIGISGDGNLVKRQAYDGNEYERIVLKPVIHGTNYLRSIAEKIASIFRTINENGEPLIFSSGVDEPNNRVFVRGRTKNFDLIRETLQRAGIDTKIIHIEEQDGPVTLM